jgi:hypothetical protein
MPACMEVVLLDVAYLEVCWSCHLPTGRIKQPAPAGHVHGRRHGRRFAVNGLLGVNATFALYIVGLVLGGVIVASTSAGVALFFDSFGALILLAAVLMSVPRTGKTPDALRRAHSHQPGWRILRRRPLAARLLIVQFFFNFFYRPIEPALLPYVREHWTPTPLAWVSCGCTRGGAFARAGLVNQLRHLPQRHVLIAITGL